MSIMSDEVNFLIYRYLQESGYNHSAFAFGVESHIAQSNVNGNLVPPGALISILQKGIQYIEGELCVNDDGSLIDDLDNIPSLPLIDAVIPEALSQRAATIYRDIAAKSDIAKSLPLSDGQQGISEDDDTVVCLRGHQTEVFSCTWNCNSRLLASNDSNSIVAIWDLECFVDGKPKMIQLDHNTNQSGAETRKTGDITCLTWSPDGEYLSTAWAIDFNVRIWSNDGAAVSILEGHVGLIFNIKWNSNSSMLLSSGIDNRVVVWSASNWEKKQTIDFHQGPVVDIDWQNNTYFASGSTDKTVCMWRVATDKPVKICQGHNAEINAVKWNSTGSILASCSDDKTIKLWSPKQEGPQDLVGHTKEVTVLEWSPVAPTLLASASYDTTVRLWNADTSECLFTLTRHLEPVNSINFSPSGQYLVSGTLDGLINIWDTQSGELVHTHRNRCGIFEVRWSPDSKKIAFSLQEKMVKVLDTRKFLESLVS